MNDLISRAAAIEAAFKGADDWDGGFSPKYLMAIPAVNAIPVEWLEQQFYDNPKSQWAEKCRDVYTKWQKWQRWQKEQEASK